jgi:hypothetical protein
VINTDKTTDADAEQLCQPPQTSRGPETRDAVETAIDAARSDRSSAWELLGLSAKVRRWARRPGQRGSNRTGRTIA